MHSKAQRIVSVLLSVVMVLTIFGGMTFTAGATTYEVGDIVEFGSYPQTALVNDPELDWLRAHWDEFEWKSYGYYSGTCNWNAGEMAPSDLMMYCDVTYNGQKFRGVYISELRPYVTDWESDDSDYSYQDYYVHGGDPDSGASNYCATWDASDAFWFRYEPLQWTVLDPDTGLMVCTSIIDSQPYNNYTVADGTNADLDIPDELFYIRTSPDNAPDLWYGDPGENYYANDYEHCSLRAWLNDDFCNAAFTEEEQHMLIPTELDNSSYVSSGDGVTLLDGYFDSQPTTDKVFLLSAEDIVNPSYGFSNYFSALDDARLKVGTHYAQCQGLEPFNKEDPDFGMDYDEHGDPYVVYEIGPSSTWWLRSPSGYTSQSAWYVMEKGDADDEGNVNYTCYGVCPAITLDLCETPTDEINATIADDIALNFTLDFDDREDVQEVSLTHKNFNGETVTDTYTAEEFAALRQADGRYKFNVRVAPAQVADEIAVKVDGETVTTTSTKAYLEVIQANENGDFTAEEAALAGALLRYGQAALGVFPTYNPGVTITADMDGVTASVTDEWHYLFNDPTGLIENVSFVALVQPEFRFYTPALSETQAAAYNETLTIAFADGGDPDRLHAQFYKDEQNRVLLEVTGVYAEDMGRAIEITIGDQTITFAGNDLAKLMSKSTSSEALSTFGAALYLYGKAAEACFQTVTD